MKYLIPLFLIIPAIAQESAEPKKDTTQELVQHLLNQDLGIRKFPFTDVVHAASGKKVLPFDSDNQAHAIVLKAIFEAADKAITKLNSSDSPIKELRRINEASRFFEDELIVSISSYPQIETSIPKNNQGREQRTGYPDILITHIAKNGEKTNFYLDPKLYEKKSRASSLRTFYYEPRTRTNKIKHDAIHLLIGFSHDGKDGDWTFLGWEICDLSTFEVRLKAEFQASNRDLYRPKSIISSSSDKK